MELLVVVDYQNDFVNGTLGFNGAESIDIEIAKTIRKHAEKGNMIVQTFDTHNENYMDTREGKHLPVMHCQYESNGWKTYGETAKAIDDVDNGINVYKINKTTFGVSPYRILDMIGWLNSNGYRSDKITKIELVGLVSNICVLSNVCTFQAAFPNAQIVVNPKLTASFDNELHEAALKVMRGIQVEFIEN